MTTFVLVHGAWHGGWCYKRVARLLRQAGHEVYTPTLTGLGERAHLMGRMIDLSTHIQDIVGVICCEELTDVVLCGHSYGGMVVAGVAEQITAKIRSLVYLDAFVPENGKSLFDYLPAEQSGQMRMDAAQNGEGYKITPIPAAAFAVNEKDPAWVDAMCVKQPLPTFEQKLALSGRRVPKRVYILAAGWEPSPFQQFGARYKNDRDWRFVSIACGHDVMVDRPRELADMLITAAQGSHKLVDFRGATSHFVDKEFDGESVQIYEPGESDPVAPPDNALPTDEEGVPLPETPGADETLVDQPGLPLAPEGPQKKVYVDGVGARARLAAMA